MQRAHAVRADHVQYGEGDLFVNLVLVRATSAAVRRTSTCQLLIDLERIDQVLDLPAVDGDDVRHDGGQEQANGKEGGQGVDESAEAVTVVQKESRSMH